MKQRIITPRPADRVRRFTREILLASAITAAAIAMFFAATDETEFAAAPPAATAPGQSN